MNIVSIENLIDTDRIQKIQDELSLAMDLAIILVDYKGNPVTKHSRCSEFCRRARLDERLGELCEKCDSRGGLEAVREEKAFIYKCHVGLVDIAIPIIVNDQYLGALMAGQVMAKEAGGDQELEWIVSKKHQTMIDSYPYLKTYYKEIPVMDICKVKAISNTLEHMLSYMIDEAIVKKELYDEVDDVQLYYRHEFYDEDTVLYPALEFIDNHYQEKLHMDDLAKLCHISTGYFSKLFKRETGKNFTTYVNDVKLEKSKYLLEHSRRPIINISSDLGYDDCGYFIKLFKKKYNVTPAAHRRSVMSRLHS